MIWAFENDTSAIIKKLAKKSVKFDRKKNLFCLIAIIVAVSMVMMSLLTVQNIIHQNQTEVEELHQGIFFDIRNRKKSLLTILSMSLCGIIFFLSASYQSSFNAESMARSWDMRYGDFKISVDLENDSEDLDSILRLSLIHI